MNVNLLNANSFVILLYFLSNMPNKLRIDEKNYLFINDISKTEQQ